MAELSRRSDPFVCVDRHAESHSQTCATTPSSSVARRTSATEVTPLQHLAQPHRRAGCACPCSWAFLLDGLRVDVLGDQRADVVVDEHQLEDPLAPPVAGVVAAGAALRRDRSERPFRRAQADLPLLLGAGFVGLAAILAQDAHQALGDDGDQRGTDQEGLHPHVDQSRDGARRVVGVERREDQVAGERGLDRDLGGLQVADLAHQDHVGVLPQHRAQGVGEAETDLGVHLDLADAGQLDLHRIVDGDDVPVRAR